MPARCGWRNLERRARPRSAGKSIEERGQCVSQWVQGVCGIAQRPRVIAPRSEVSPSGLERQLPRLAGCGTHPEHHPPKKRNGATLCPAFEAAGTPPRGSLQTNLRHKPLTRLPLGFPLPPFLCEISGTVDYFRTEVSLGPRNFSIFAKSDAAWPTQLIAVRTVATFIEMMERWADGRAESSKGRQPPGTRE